MSDSARAFHESIATDDPDAIRAQLDADESLVDAEHRGMRPLLTAIFARRQDNADVLIERGATIGCGEAAAMGSIEHLRRVADEGAQLNAPAAGGWTPLHLAGFMGQTGAARWLLDSGADPAALSENAEKNTALHAAIAGGGGLEVQRILLAGGADPSARANLGVTPLHLAASRGDDEAVTLLLEHGASPAPMDNGALPSRFARDRGHPELAERLEALEP